MRNMRTLFEFFAPFIIWSPTASKLQLTDTEDVVSIDSLSLQKWLPVASEIYSDEF